MQVFVYEHLCAGGTAAAPALGALHAEGWAMLSAVLEDFGRVPGVEVVTVLDERLTAAPPQVRVERPGTPFAALAGACDYTLIIAPECDGLLWELNRQAEAAGGRLLGSSPDAVRLTGDKLALAEHLCQHDIRTPPCAAYAAGAVPPEAWWPVVWKPRFGAGAVATFLVRRREDFAAFARAAREEGWAGETVVQPFVAGQAASVAALVGAGRPLALLPATQTITCDGRFHYQGGRIPLRAELGRRAVALALQAVAAVPGLRGYVGVDVVLGDAEDGSRDWVIEINPRLTTSYVGLRALARSNLAEAILRLAAGQPVAAIDWQEGSVYFRADGTVVRGGLPSPTMNYF
jgi:predicted ATP-grasp superfamily ATP-dependent carboligase